MKRWALFVVVLYGIAVLLAVWAAAAPAFWPSDDWLRMPLLTLRFDESWWAWGLFGLMLLLQAAVLVVPVRVEAQLPVPRRHLVWGYLAAALASLVLLGGIGAALWEHVAHSEDGTTSWEVLFGAAGGLWLAWMILFSFYMGKTKPVGHMGRLVRWLLAGSVAEILIVIPVHAIARYRNYCCAGFMTFVGLATGTAVLLLAFGPGVFVLFVRRLRSYRRPDAKRQ